MGLVLPRSKVYGAIDSERKYQDNLYPQCNKNTVGEELVLLKSYVDRAFEAWTDNPGDIQCLDVIRKVVGIGVRCLENHGVPMRAPAGGNISIPVEAQGQASSGAPILGGTGQAPTP